MQLIRDFANLMADYQKLLLQNLTNLNLRDPEMLTMDCWKMGFFIGNDDKSRDIPAVFQVMWSVRLPEFNKEYVNIEFFINDQW